MLLVYHNKSGAWTSTHRSRSWTPALEAAQRCVDVAGNLGRVYVVRAAVYQALGRPQEALADYRKALQDFPYLFNDEQRAWEAAGVSRPPS